MTRFKENSFEKKTKVNLLLASQQLETFAIKYVMKRLPRNVTFYYSAADIGEHFGEQFKTVSVCSKEPLLRKLRLVTYTKRVNY